MKWNDVNSYLNTAWWCNNHLEKYEFVNGKDDIPFLLWKIKAMFQTINQNMCCFVLVGVFLGITLWLFNSLLWTNGR